MRTENPGSVKDGKSILPAYVGNQPTGQFGLLGQCHINSGL